MDVVRDNYERGDIPLEQMCELAIGTLEDFQVEGPMNGLSVAEADRLLGQMVRSVLQNNMKPRKEGAGEQSQLLLTEDQPYRSWNKPCQPSISSAADSRLSGSSTSIRVSNEAMLPPNDPVHDEKPRANRGNKRRIGC